MSDTDHLDAESQGIHNHHQQHHNFYSHRQTHIHTASQGHVTGHHVHLHDMHMHGPIEGDVHCDTDAQVHGGDHGHGQYVHEHRYSLAHNEDNGIEEEQDECGGDNDGMEGDLPSDGGNLGDPQVVVPVRIQGTNQLTLSYQGEVYVFDTVPPEKHGLEYAHNENFTLEGFSDSDWAGCQDSRRSTSGYCFSLGSTVVSWSCKKQPNVTLSSTEAEYKAIVSAACEAIWLRRILGELGLEQNHPTRIYCDNQSVLKLAKNPVFHARTKHIEVHHHFIREHV